MPHTPGPWMVDTTKALGAYGVWTDYATHPGHDGAGYGSQICSIQPTVQSEIPREQRDANARLIAAAPDLLAALKRLLAAVDAEQVRRGLASGSWTTDSPAGMAVAAITKAEGE